MKIDQEKKSEIDFINSLSKYGNHEKNTIKIFKQKPNYEENNKNRKILSLPKFFSFKQDNKLRFLWKKFKENPFRNFLPLLKTFSSFVIQNNSFLLKTFIAINDSLILEIFKLFNFYTAISLRAMIATYIELNIKWVYLGLHQIKISLEYYYKKLRFR